MQTARKECNTKSASPSYIILAGVSVAKYSQIHVVGLMTWAEIIN